MPQRFLKPGLTESDKWNALDWRAQSFYIRLLTLVDDAGRYEVKPHILLSRAFPGRVDVTVMDVQNMLTEMDDEELIVLYSVNEKRFLAFTNWTERIRERGSKYPPCPADHPRVQDCAAHEDNVNKAGKNAKSPHVQDCAARAGAPPSPSPSPSPSPDAMAPSAESLPRELQLWNLNPKLPSARGMSQKRWRALKARRKDGFFRDNFAAAVSRVSKSSFLLGNNDRNWIANFDWMLRPDTVIKIMEGQYDDQENGNGKRPDSRRADRDHGTANHGRDDELATG